MAESTGKTEKNLAAVCGLYCEACSLFIATKEDPERLKQLAAKFQLSEEVMRCYGCRSEKRGPYRQQCAMFSCAAERGVDFCVECPEYPCETLKAFQAERPHRIELWEDLERIGAVGYTRWLEEARKKYSCPACKTLNSAYDLKCRNCGEEPSCEYVAKHGEEIRKVLEVSSQKE